MVLFYNISIWFYGLAIKMASPFNQKAKQWIDGRKDIFNKIKSSLNDDEKIAWFHVSSLGEFEQGKPVIEAYKVRHPDWEVLVTFFSPSGYEVRKDTEVADFVMYLPIENKTNIKL